ncbi:hypothetical protein [Spirosoma spitsbergense]|uniref:hypothetical protein n=1 Tax=Spirosoma spitsbergense TaxID=431554 RepID=UPI00037D09CD
MVAHVPGAAGSLDENDLILRMVVPQKNVAQPGRHQQVERTIDIRGDLFQRNLHIVDDFAIK